MTDPVTKDDLQSCQKDSRNRFWAVASSCIGLIVVGLIVGSVMIGKCADEDKVDALTQQVTRTSATVDNLAKTVREYIGDKKIQDKDQDEKIRLIELENARRNRTVPH